MQLGIDKIPVLVVGERFAKYDGGPGSGNFNHEGRPGEVGGSAPKGSADSTASVQKLSKLKDGFSNLTNKQQFAFLKKTGVIPAWELESLGNGAKNNDPVAVEKIGEYAADYFKKASFGRTVKSLECSGRDRVVKMSQKDKQEWINRSINRNFQSWEDWANHDSAAQKVAIDLGLRKTPQVVSHDDFKKYVEESGAIVCYRGVGNTDSMTGASMLYQMAYKTQEPYFGNGVYGDGLYFSTNQNTAISYSNGSEAIAMCAIRPDAKVIGRYSQELRATMKKLGTTDISIAAMCSGYDAIKVEMSKTENYYVILNKAALVMADPVDVLSNTAIRAAERNAAKKSSS